VFGFVGFVLIVVVGVHLYLWKRLVRDPLRPGPWRKLGGFAVLVLALLIPTTLILTRNGYVEWLAWPGYLWIALMFYLLVILVVLEIPRLIIRLVWRARRTETAAAAPDGTDRGDSAVASTVAARAGSTGAGARTGAGASTVVDTEPGGAKPGAKAGGAETGGAETGGGEPGGAETGDARPGGARPGGARPDGVGPGGADHGGAGSTATGDGEKPGIDRRLLLARGAAIFAGLTAAGITGYGVRTALAGPQLDRVQIPIAKLPRAMDGTRLAVVSDIHLGPLTGSNHLPRIVSMINSTQADVVCIVGDMVDGTVEELGAEAAALRDIRARQGTYFVTGNHEYYSGFQEWVAEVARLGVRPLRNERLEISTGRGVFDLAGVNDPGGADVGDAPDFDRALGDRDTSRPVVLMAHQPVVAHDAARYGVDLQVSGHTHGGQMLPFNYLVGLEQPVVSGLGKVDGLPVYVTNGAGFWGPPVRVGAPPQVTLIELRAP
jgi:predicted MPP superfamily phosphohydrolase